MSRHLSSPTPCAVPKAPESLPIPTASKAAPCRRMNRRRPDDACSRHARTRHTSAKRYLGMQSRAAYRTPDTGSRKTRAPHARIAGARSIWDGIGGSRGSDGAGRIECCTWLPDSLQASNPPPPHLPHRKAHKTERRDKTMATKPNNASHARRGQSVQSFSPLSPGPRNWRPTAAPEERRTIHALISR